MFSAFRSESSFRPRHEMKFVVPKAVAECVREYVAAFCEPDPMAVGSPPRYKVTTLQLDSPDLSLHYAKDRELKTRFKLRVRSYGGPDSECPVFVEIKRKFNSIVSKSRAKLSRKSYERDIADGFLGKAFPGFSCKKDEDTFSEFLRLANAIDAGPVMRIRYDRECWVGREDASVRVTIDDRLEYQTTTDYRLFEKSALWQRADLGRISRRSEKMVILELKCGMEVPSWLIRLVQQFGLRRVGFCKYSEAVELEKSFAGLGSFPQLHFRGNLNQRAV